MVKVIIKRTQNMSRLVRAGLLLLFTLLASALLQQGLLGPRDAEASVAAVNNWPATPQIVSNAATGTVSGAVTVGAGTNRVLLVAVAAEYSATPGSQPISVSYGGKQLIQLQNNFGCANTIWLGYLNEAGIASASGTTLSVTNGNTSGLVAMYASAAVFSGVDQTSPISGANSVSCLGAAVSTMNLPPIKVKGAAGNTALAFYISNRNGQAQTVDPSYTQTAQYTGTSFVMAFNTITTAPAALITTAPAATTATASLGSAVSVGLVPAGVVGVGSASTCTSCHFKSGIADSATRAGGLFPGSHAPHSGTAANQHGYVCSTCHYNNTTLNHSQGFKNITGSKVPGNAYSQGKRIAVSTAPTLGYCSSTVCHGTKSPTWGTPPNPTGGACMKCHGSQTTVFATVSSANVAPGTGNLDTGRAAGVTQRGGVHQEHLVGTNGIAGNKIKCSDCHAQRPTNSTVTQINTAPHLQYTTAKVALTGRATLKSHAPAMTRNASGAMTCSNTYCHTGNLNTGSGNIPAWNDGAYLAGAGAVADCNKCHALPPVTATSHVGMAAVTTTAGFATCANGANGGTGCHSSIKGAPANFTITAVFNDPKLHLDGDAEAGHAFPYGGSVHMPTGSGNPKSNVTASYTNCNGCHDTTSAGGTYPVAAGVMPLCSACHKTNFAAFSGTNTNGCLDCHGSTRGLALANYSDARPNGNVFPNISGSHTKHVIGQALTCNDCHFNGGTGSARHGASNRVNSTNVTFVNLSSSTGRFHATKTATQATCSNVACHGTAVWGVTKFNCVTCHDAAVTITKGPLATNGNQRRKVSSEFMSTWSHIRSMKAAAGGTITTVGTIPPAVCVACHMEGDPATGGTAASFHGNGYVDLRDPDTGLIIQNVVWVSAAGNGGGWYTSTGTPLNNMAAFRRNLASATLEPEVQATQINFCIKCHDGNGALSTLARVGGAATPALRPFNVVVKANGTTTAMSSMGNMSNGAGNVVDVYRHFMTTNASYHPVLGRGNNSYIRGNMLLPPWNSISKTVAAANQWGNLISCWDCHAPTNTAWTTAGTNFMLTYSVTAHGGPATVRAPTHAAGTTAANNLCLNCHRTAYGAGNGSHNNLATGGFGTSAFNSGNSNMSTTTFSNCWYCHAYNGGAGSTATAPVRPGRAENVHGFNDRTMNVAGSVFTSSGGNRPYAFIRNGLTGWRPAAAPGLTTQTTGNCYGSGGTCNNNMTGDTYTPGGTY